MYGIEHSTVVTMGYLSPNQVLYRFQPVIHVRGFGPLSMKAGYDRKKKDLVKHINEKFDILKTVRVASYEGFLRHAHIKNPADLSFRLNIGQFCLCKRLSFRQNVHRKSQTRFGRIVQIVSRIATGYYLVKDVVDGLEFKMSIDFLHPLPKMWDKQACIKFMSNLGNDYLRKITLQNIFENYTYIYMREYIYMRDIY